jgi:hypothetical protein
VPPEQEKDLSPEKYKGVLIAVGGNFQDAMLQAKRSIGPDTNRTQSSGRDVSRRNTDNHTQKE